MIVVSGLITIPLTYSLLRPSSDPSALAPKISTTFKPKDAGEIEKQRAVSRRGTRRTKSILLVVVGWAVIGFMVYLIITTEIKQAKLYDPYDILGISSSSTEKQIKKAFKKLSLKFHPDKIRIDPSKNETIESVNAKYVELTKAYQALTDEEIRNNWINFGNPDGKQSFSYGIGLPSFLVSNTNVTRAVIVIYCVLFFNVLPYVVGSWWYGLQRVSKDGVLMESANNLFREYTEQLDEGSAVTALSSGKEFEATVKKMDESRLSRIESKILAEGELGSYAGGLSTKDKIKLEDLENGERRKALALLWAYLGRVDLEDASLNALKYKVAPIALDLTKSFTSISLAFQNAGPIGASFRTSQALIQALPPKSSPLLQLPYFTPKVIKAIQGNSKIHHTVQKFMDLPDSARRRMAVGPELLSGDEYTAAVKVAKQLPYFRVAKAFFKVTGEKFIIASSLVSLIVKGRFVPPGSENVPDINETDLEDIDPPEDDLDAILGRKKKTKKTTDGKIVDKDDTTSLLPIAFAPYFPRNHSPKWFVYLTDMKQGKMAVPPFTFAQFDEPIFTPDGKPTFAMQTLKAQFQAPPQPGKYTFVMHVVCDSYIGFDTKMEVTLQVDTPDKAAEMKADDEISEPDEGVLSPNVIDMLSLKELLTHLIIDSLAGQMHALKTGSAPQPSKKKIEESDDESSTDDDQNDTSDTNTDTEDES